MQDNYSLLERESRVLVMHLAWNASNRSNSSVEGNEDVHTFAYDSFSFVQLQGKHCIKKALAFFSTILYNSSA